MTRQVFTQNTPAIYSVSLMNEDGSLYASRNIFAANGDQAATEYVRLYAIAQAAIEQSIDVMVTDLQGSQIFTVSLLISAKLR